MEMSITEFEKHLIFVWTTYRETLLQVCVTKNNNNKKQITRKVVNCDF